MKSFFLIGTIFLITSVAFSQNTNGYEKSNTTIAIDSTITVKSNTTITIGLNIIDNNNHVGGSGIVPFIGGKLDFKTPFFITAERRFNSNFSTSLSLSTNQLNTKTGDKFYVAVDAMGQFYFNKYLFNSEKIETYAGLGLGRYVFENKGNNTFNILGGIRYWFSDHYGVSTQFIGKIGLPPVNVDLRNNYQLNLGLVWHN